MYYYCQTYKEKLKEDRKTVLKYQLITGTSLKDIDPSLSIENMKSEIDYYLNKKKSYRKVFTGTVYNNITTEEELFNIKHFNIIKYIDAEFRIFDHKLTVRQHKLSKEEAIQKILSSIEKYTDYSITIEKYYKYNKPIYMVFISFNLLPENDKTLYYNYLKNDIRLLTKYQTNTSITINNIVRMKTNKSIMCNYFKNINRNITKEIKLESIEKMNVEKMDNLYIQIIIESNKFNDEDDEIEFTNVDEAIRFINEEKLNELELIKVEYKKFISSTRINRFIIIRYKDNNVYEDNEKVFTEDLDVIDSFNGYVFTHGLYAYNRNIDSIEDRILAITDNENVEICCSWTNDYIGPFGVYVQGDCKIASLFDIGSDYDKNTSKRYILKERMNPDWLITSPDKIVYSNVTSGEAIVTNVKIVGIWKDKRFNDENGYVEKIKEMTGIQNVKLIEAQHMTLNFM